MKKSIFYLFMASFCLLFSNPGKATHILGGEITYRCLGAGLFEFTVVVYRDCGGNTAGFNNLTINLQGPHGQTTLPLINSTDISPRCDAGTAFTCNPPTTGSGSQGSVSRFVFRGNVNLSNVAPPPVTIGHTFWVSLPCCRSSAIFNSLAVNGSQSLVVRMYRYTDPLTGNALTPAQLCDQSPVFDRDLSTVFVQNPLDTVYLQSRATDADAPDSMSFQISAPLNDQRVPYAYTFPYALNNPLPGLLGPPSVPAAHTPIHPQNGEIAFRPTVAGTFVMVIQLTSYRNGQKIAEVYRDANVKIIPNPVGAPPIFEPNSNQVNHPFSQRAPIIHSPLTSANWPTRWEYQAYAALDSVMLTIPVSDYFPSLQGNPQLPSSWTAYSSPFVVSLSSPLLSSNNTTASGCDLPPCATMRAIADPNPPDTNVTQPVMLTRGNGQAFGQGYQNQVSGGIKLFFTPGISHLVTTPNQASREKHHVFNVSALDRNCPMEGESRRVVQVTVKPFPAYQAPQLDSLVSAGGLVRLHFWSGFDTLSIDALDLANFVGQLTPANQQMLLQRSIERRLRAFDGLRIYKAAQRNGPYQLLTTLTDPRVRSWVDSGSFLGSYYYVEHISGRPLQSRRSQDTLSTCNLGLLDVLSPQGNWLCGSSTLTLIAGLQGSGLAFAWYKNQQQLAGQSGASLVVSDTGRYQLAVFDSTIGCWSYTNPYRVRRGGPFMQEQLCAVTVDSITGRNLIMWEKTPDQGTKSYWLLREQFTTGVYDTLANIPWILAGAFLDTAANTTASSWKYTLLLEDSCNQRSALSPLHRSMHLMGQDNGNNEVLLTWNKYEGRAITNQQVMFSQGSSIFSQLATLSDSATTFIHQQAPPGPKAYYIAIGSRAACEPLPGVPFPARVLSNVALVGSGVGLPWLDAHRAVVYPNPGTGMFRASWDAPALEEQQLQVYNGQGQLVRHFKLYAGENTLELDLQGEAPGIYLLRSQGSAWSQRLVLVR